MISSPSKILTEKGESLIEVRYEPPNVRGPPWDLIHISSVSRLYAHSKNYDMDLTLDYNTELFPLQKGQTLALALALALASSLARGPAGASSGDDDDDDKEKGVWRPDGKGRRGLEEDYDYVMYGKVYRFDPGTAEVVYVPSHHYTVILANVRGYLGLRMHRSVGY